MKRKTISFNNQNVKNMFRLISGIAYNIENSPLTLS